MAEKIVIDAGHDGIGDPGAVYNGRRESDDNLDMALAVGDILSRNGYDVEYTRTGSKKRSSPTTETPICLFLFIGTALPIRDNIMGFRH